MAATDLVRLAFWSEPDKAHKFSIWCFGREDASFRLPGILARNPGWKHRYTVVARSKVMQARALRIARESALLARLEPYTREHKMVRLSERIASARASLEVRPHVPIFVRFH